MTSSRSILHLRFDLPPGADVELPEQLRRLLETITPRVQMTEPDSAVLDLTGALPYFQRDARGLTELIQLRILAHFGVRSAAGAAPTRTRQVPEFLQSWDSEPDRPWRLRGRLTVRLRSPWQVPLAPGEGGRR
ncbi:hypothetical protein ABZX90_38540 [Streptomyces sp. NPDC002935]|uniref:hypothetical protein n=1 Tax=Streptomyces sp. NPDC002935 TaxID=3154545 RepID=UPI0033A0DAB9